MTTKTALDMFNAMDLRDYAGMAVGIVDGRIAFKDKNPEKVMKRLLTQPRSREVALICVPSSKAAMVI